MRGEMIPCSVKLKEGKRTKDAHSYVATMTQIGGSIVTAVRLDWYTSKYDRDIRAAIEEIYPPDVWKLKSLQRLYDEDFEEVQG